MAGQTVQLWIHTYSDVRLGPFQVNLTRCGQSIQRDSKGFSGRARDIGVCSVELQKQVLPECAQSSEYKACFYSRFQVLSEESGLASLLRSKKSTHPATRVLIVHHSGIGPSSPPLPMLVWRRFDETPGHAEEKRPDLLSFQSMLSEHALSMLWAFRCLLGDPSVALSRAEPNERLQAARCEGSPTWAAPVARAGTTCLARWGKAISTHFDSFNESFEINQKKSFFNSFFTA